LPATDHRSGAILLTAAPRERTITVAPGPDETMLLQLRWQLPRLPATVGMARHVLDCALKALGVTAECRSELVLALSEACSNAVEHACLGAGYCLSLTADQHRCTVEITDAGIGLGDGHRDRETAPGPVADRGRGIGIIRACTDWLELDPVEPHGLAVRFGKQLSWETGACGRRAAPADWPGPPAAPHDRWHPSA
jgi:serine/threonine-protein kinase RsbW